MIIIFWSHTYISRPSAHPVNWKQHTISPLPSYSELSSTFNWTTSVILSALSASLFKLFSPNCSPCNNQNYSLKIQVTSCHFCVENLSYLSTASQATMGFPHCLPEHSSCLPSSPCISHMGPAFPQSHQICCFPRAFPSTTPLSWLPPPQHSNMLCSFIFSRDSPSSETPSLNSIACPTSTFTLLFSVALIPSWGSIYLFVDFLSPITRNTGPNRAMT